MRFRVRNEHDTGAGDGAAIVTYSRVTPRGGGRRQGERQEPVLMAEEMIPPVRPDVGGFDRVVPDESYVDFDDFDDEPLRPKRRRRGRGFVLVGALAVAAGMIVLAYAYGVATQVGAPSQPTADGSANAPVAGQPLPQGGLTAGSAVVGTGDSVRVVDTAPPSAPSAPMRGTAAPAGETTASLPPADATAQPPKAQPPTPQARPAPATPAAAAPALVAPVPATSTPPPAATAKAASPAAPDAQSGDSNFINNIESILKRDGATAGASGQSGDGLATPAGPTPLGGSVGASASGDANAASGDTTPPPANALLLPPADAPLLPPADIPNVPPSGSGTQ